MPQIAKSPYKTSSFAVFLRCAQLLLLCPSCHHCPPLSTTFRHILNAFWYLSREIVNIRQEFFDACAILRSPLATATCWARPRRHSRDLGCLFLRLFSPSLSGRASASGGSARRSICPLDRRASRAMLAAVRPKGVLVMEWITPQHEEIDLNCEVSSYANAEL